MSNRSADKPAIAEIPLMDHAVAGVADVGRSERSDGEVIGDTPGSVAIYQSDAVLALTGMVLSTL